MRTVWSLKLRAGRVGSGGGGVAAELRSRSCLVEAVGLAGGLWMGEVAVVMRPRLLPSASQIALMRIGGEMGGILLTLERESTASY